MTCKWCDEGCRSCLAPQLAAIFEAKQRRRQHFALGTSFVRLMRDWRQMEHDEIGKTLVELYNEAGKISRRTGPTPTGQNAP